MFESITKFFKRLGGQQEENVSSKDAAKERLHLVLMQDRANVSADFLDLMRKEIIEVIKKYIDVDEREIDVRLTNKQNDDGTTGAPALYANIPIVSIKEEVRREVNKQNQEGTKTQPKEEKKDNDDKIKDAQQIQQQADEGTKKEVEKEEIKASTKEKENKCKSEQNKKETKQEKEEIILEQKRA